MPLPSSARPSDSSFRRLIPVAGLLALVLLAAGLRAWLQFGTPLVPGMNGAYYLVQARAVLEQGHLGIPDLPLTFWLHAVLARLIALATSWPQDDAIVFAVKLADSVLPPLVALPVAWLGARWQSSDPRLSLRAVLAPAALVCLSAAPLAMTGDFQENSLALVWFAGAAWAAHRFLCLPSLSRGAALAGALGLLGVTHVGVLGSALVFLGCLAVVATLSAAAATRRRILLGACGGLIALLIGAAITYQHDPARVRRLWRAATEPSTVLESSGGPDTTHPSRNSIPAMTRPPSLPDDETAPRDAAPDFRPPLEVDHGASDHGASPNIDSAVERSGPPPPPWGGPPGGPGRWPSALPRGLFLVVGLIGLGMALAQRKRLPAPDFSIGTAAAVTTAVLGAGFFDGDKAQRLMLIAVVPAGVTLSFVLAQIPSPRWRGLLALVVIAFTGLSGGLYAARGGRAIITVPQHDELRRLAAKIPQPSRTLIVAHHGLEWWTAWITRAHIAQPTALSREDWGRYDHVYYLNETRANRARERGPADAGPGFGPPGRRGDFGPPGMGPDTLPVNADPIHSGAQYILARVATAPENQPSDAEIAARRRDRR